MTPNRQCFEGSTLWKGVSPLWHHQYFSGNDLFQDPLPASTKCNYCSKVCRFQCAFFFFLDIPFWALLWSKCFISQLLVVLVSSSNCMNLAARHRRSSKSDVGFLQRLLTKGPGRNVITRWRIATVGPKVTPFHIRVVKYQWFLIQMDSWA